jgi:hypothetical protein
MVGRRYLTVTAVSIVLVVAMTWPLGRLAPPIIPASDDANFSIWRMAWIAHQLAADPTHLFDANVFHPATNTLALSDAMLLVGLAASPLFYLGMDPAHVHNRMLLAAIVLSMVAAFALARRLTGSSLAAFLAAIIFGLAPYRMAHIGHLELQWTMWMPLGMLMLHRLVEKPTLRNGALLGVALTAQVLCSIYYGLFLACYLVTAWLALIPFEKDRARIMRASAIAVVPLLLVAIVYGPPYAQTREQFGNRRPDEVQTFSAVPADYLRVPQENSWRGKADSGPAADERSLFPGAVAIALSLVALIPPISRPVWTYLFLAIVAADFSLGVNGLLFPWLQLAFDAATSLRAPARFGVLVLMSLSILAAIGATRIMRRWPRAAVPVAVLLGVGCIAEYWSAPLPARLSEAKATPAHEWLARQRSGSVVLELPAPTGQTLWLYEGIYQVRSITHWQPLINGYSAFPPPQYVRLIDQLPRFPERHVIEMLRERQVTFILINRRYYTQPEFDVLMTAVRASSRLSPAQSFGEGDNQILVVELKQSD